MSKYYVVMEDTFFGHWGDALGRANKVIIKCDSLQEMDIVIENANSRSDMVNIKAYRTLPYFSPKRYLVQIYEKEHYPSWFERNAFVKEGVN